MESSMSYSSSSGYTYEGAPGWCTRCKKGRWRQSLGIGCSAAAHPGSQRGNGCEGQLGHKPAPGHCPTVQGSPLKPAPMGAHEHTKHHNMLVMAERLRV
jgi:hypothetical protein